jgi:hypothetical protein
MHFWRKIFCSPDTEPQYLHSLHSITIYLSELFSSFFQHAKMIQNKFQLTCQDYHPLLVAYICLSPGFLKMSGISRALTDRLCANRWPYRLGWGPVNWVKVRVGCKQGSCKLIVSKNLMCTQPCVILCWINSS